MIEEPSPRDVVYNTTTIDNYFTLTTTNINLSSAITGDSEKSEMVGGTDGDDLIADGRGRDKLIGGDGADQFYFSGEELFKKKKVDKVVDFDASEGDKIVIDDDVFGGLTKDPTLAIAYNKKQLKKLSKKGHDLIYFHPKGDLYVDGNGNSKGFGNKSEGGIIADLPKKAILTEGEVLIGFSGGNDAIAPTVASATLDEYTLSVEFDSIIGSKGSARQRFKVKADGKKIRVKSITVDQSDSYLELTLQPRWLRKFETSSKVTLSYNDSKGDQTRSVIEDVFGNDLDSFSGYGVEVVKI